MKVAPAMRNVLLALLFVLLLPATAAAEVDRPGRSEIRQDGARITWVIGLPADELATLANGDSREAFAGYMANNVRLAQNDSSCPGGMAHATPERFDGATFARVVMRYECPEEYGRFMVTSEMLVPFTLDYRLGGANGTARFDADRTVVEFKSPEFPRHLRDGFEALALGWQHVLFLAILLLGARSRREFATFAGGFAAASLLGLLLGASDVVNIPERTLEALTVASIVGVAALPVLGIAGTAQLAIVLALALVHGLSLATSVPDSVALPGFALGVLLAEGLLVTLLAALPLAWRALGRTPGAPDRGRARSAAR